MAEMSRPLGPSPTGTLANHAAGLMKHATFVERVWFDQTTTCRSCAEIADRHDEIVNVA
jgi:Protein of unknown function (DUF664)